MLHDKDLEKVIGTFDKTIFSKTKKYKRAGRLNL
jgi:hypothetical protein